MANLSKRNPWGVEMMPVGSPNWYVIDAFADEAEAKRQADVVRDRAEANRNPVPVRVRHISKES